MSELWFGCAQGQLRQQCRCPALTKALWESSAKKAQCGVPLSSPTFTLEPFLALALCPGLSYIATASQPCLCLAMHPVWSRPQSTGWHPGLLWSSCISVDLPGDHRCGPGPCCPQQSYTALIVQIPLDWTLVGELLPCCHSWLPAPFPLWGRPRSLLCVIWNKWTVDNVYYNIATCCWFKYNQELILGAHMWFFKDKRFLRLNIDIMQMFHNSSSNAVSAVLQG